jgi:hypothetical protein
VSKDRRKDLRLVKPEDEIDPERLDEQTEALKAAIGGSGQLDEMDHEALLAMTLGDDVTELDDEETLQAAKLRDALDGRGDHELRGFVDALRATHAATVEVEEDRDDTDLELMLTFALGDDLAKIADDERQEAESLRRALERGDGRHPEARLAASLRFADQTPALEAADGEALLALAGLDEALAVDEDERHQAEALAEALGGRGQHPLASLATSLRAANGTLPSIDELRHRRALNTALDHHSARRQGRGVVLGAIVALAAGVALFFGSMSWLETHQAGPTAARAAAPIEARSTQELFDPAEPFPARGGESERMGRIVDARAADLRANRFAAWGVR